MRNLQSGSFAMWSGQSSAMLDCYKSSVVDVSLHCFVLFPRKVDLRRDNRLPESFVIHFLTSLGKHSMLRSIHLTLHTPLKPTYTLIRTMSSYTATQPSTLQEALERINQLESQLLSAHRLFHEHTQGLNLQDYLSTSSPNGVDRSPSPPYRSVSQTSSESPSPGPLENENEQPTYPTNKGKTVDIGTFVLRALALRKKLTIGEIDSLEGERELGNMIKGSGMTDKQENQVREWAGLL